MMTSFAGTLKSFQQGSCTKHELLAQLDDTLTRGRADLTRLLEVLDEHNAADPLPADVYPALKSRILEAIDAQNAAGGPDDGLDHGMATIFDPDAKTSGRRSAKADERSPSDREEAGATDDSERAKGIGDIVGGKYLLEELAGEGGMSRVYKAKDLDAERAQARDPYLAVKVLDESFKEHADPVVALNREFQKSTKLNHRNIVNVYHWFREGPFVYMTMEYLEGKPLSRVLKGLGRKRMRKEDALRIVREMAAALEHAHEAGIIHADFKPGNVILGKDENGHERAKVIDFGIARVIRHPDDLSDKTIFDPRKLGALTPAYASPAMIANLELDQRDDIYSLACVTYELLTGKHPFSRDHAIEAKEMGLTVERLPGLNKREWKALCSALAFERSNRTPTVRRFLQDLSPPAAKTVPATWVAAAAAAGAAVFALTYFGVSKLEEREAVESIEVVRNLQPDAPDTSTAAPAPIAEPEPEPVEPGPVAGFAFQDCDTCPEVVVLPTGEFRQGSAAEDGEHPQFEGPIRSVTIDYAIAMSAREISVAQYREFIADTGHQPTSCHVYNGNGEWATDAGADWSRPGFEQTDEHPAPCISWQDARAYVAWLSDKTGQSYRLPSESEWEFAARARTEASRSWGDDPAQACGNANVADLAAQASYPGWQVHDCDDGYANTAPGASLQANTFGLFDMQGNLFEWTEDCWNPDYAGAPTDGSPWASGDCDQRVLRGGSWYTAPTELRVAYRNRFDTDHRSSSFGFRVVRELN